MTDPKTRRTKRRYAHEIYPHPGEWEARPLAVEVPYLYAQAIGLSVHGTDWFDLFATDPAATVDRTLRMLAAREIALTADALQQGLTGDEAWMWAQQRMTEDGSWVWERAVAHGVDPDAIKPYPVRAEPSKHDHWSPRDERGWSTLVETVDRPESECEACTEPREDGAK